MAGYWSTSLAELFVQLDCDDKGLSRAEAQSRWRRWQQTHRQELAGHKTSRGWILLQQFNSPIIALLFVSALLSFALDDTTNAIIVILILLLSGLLSFWQESSAADAVARLMAIIETRCTVVRDASAVAISRQQVVPGDIVLLSAGSIVPGDCRLLETNELSVNESALTGESFPVEKQAGTVPDDTAVSKRNNCVFLGSHIVSGTARALVVSIASDTQLGGISTRLQTRPPASGFEQGLRRFGKLLLIITAGLVTLVMAAQIAFHRPIVESFLFALALAVGMTPQLLPAITSVVLANGAKTMAKARVIVKRLVAIEDFGGMNVLCMDKTGTLTVGEVHLEAARAVDGQVSSHVLELAYLNAHHQTGFANPIDRAILSASSNTLIAPDVGRKLDELPYDFHRKRLSVLVERDKVGKQVITKGAVSNVLNCCSLAQVDDGRIVPLDEIRNGLDEQFQAWSAQGWRVLGIAWRSVDQSRLQREDERDLVFAGFLNFTDPLKPGIEQTLSRLETAGIGLKLITGDNAAVARSVGQRAGLPANDLMIGSEIHQLTDDQLQQRCTATTIFAEIEPEQKERIVMALKRSGHVVGFLGDGINDAPALHTADVGISVSGAVDVAKEASQVVLLEQDLDVLIQGVMEGRRTLVNTLKYVFFAISANFGYMLSMAIASLFLPFLPLLPTQILLINLLADFPAMALATDNVDSEAVRRPRRWDMLAMTRFMLMFGLIGTCSDLLTFTLLIKILNTSPELFRTGWFLVSITTGVIIMLAIRTERPFFKSMPGGLLLFASICVLSVTYCLPYTYWGKLLELVPPTPSLLLFVGLVAMLYALAIESAKRLWQRMNRPVPTSDRAGTE